MNPTHPPTIHKRQFTAAFKAKVALEAIREVDTVNQIASRYAVHPSQVKKWKANVLAALPTLFEKYRGDELKQKDELIRELYQKVGQREIERDWLKKNLESLG